MSLVLSNGESSVNLKLYAITSDEYLIWLSSDYVTKNAAVTREAAEVFEIIIKLVDLDVLEACNLVYLPVGVADVILTQSVLNQVYLVLDFDRIHLRDDYHFTKLAEQMLVVR